MVAMSRPLIALLRSIRSCRKDSSTQKARSSRRQTERSMSPVAGGRPRFRAGLDVAANDRDRGDLPQRAVDYGDGRRAADADVSIADLGHDLVGLRIDLQHGDQGLGACARRRGGRSRAGPHDERRHAGQRYQRKGSGTGHQWRDPASARPLGCQARDRLFASQRRGKRLTVNLAQAVEAEEARNAPQLRLVRGAELHPPTDHQLSDGGGDEHLCGCRSRHDPRPDVGRDASRAAVDPLQLAGVQPGPHVEPDPMGGHQDRGGSADRIRGPIEGGEETIAGSVLLVAAIRRSCSRTRRRNAPESSRQRRSPTSPATWVESTMSRKRTVARRRSDRRPAMRRSMGHGRARRQCARDREGA